MPKSNLRGRVVWANQPNGDPSENGIAKTVILPIVVAVLTTLTTNRVMRPDVHIRFNGAFPTIVPVTERTIYGTAAVAVRIDSNITLKDAKVQLISISKRPDLKAPLNGFVKPTFGWPLGSESFQPRIIGGIDYVVIATERTDAQGNHVTFFFNEFYGMPGPENKPIQEIEFLRDLQPGTYYMLIGLLAEGIEPAEAKFKADVDPQKGLLLHIVN